MKIALAQINATLGDFAGNQERILNFIERAHKRRADLVVFPEAALFGYHPVDLLERPTLVARQEQALKEIHRKLPKGIGVLVGAIVKNPSQKGKGFWNAAVFLEKGKKAQVFAKQLLPTYDVFDEGRHIEPGDMRKNVFRFKGKKILVTICEDIWAWSRKHNPIYAQYGKNPLLAVKPRKMDLVVNLSASPFTHSKLKNRQQVVANTAKLFRCPMVYVNMVGGQDELVFDGGSFVVNSRGKILSQCIRFDEDLNIFDLSSGKGSLLPLSKDASEVTRSAIVLGLRDFVAKTGFSKVHIGLSGGVDSAVVACLAADALGPMNVCGLIMPGPFSARESAKLAKDLATNLHIKTIEISIADVYKKLVQMLEHALGDLPFGVTHENLQARLRGLLLMAYSNQERSLLLGTSNKSELAVGYSTLYGDMIGGLMPIGDLLKTEVYTLANYYNLHAPIIPEPIITRPPSAELRPNQTDQDSLPPYAELDAAIDRLVIGFHAPRNPLETQVLTMMMKSEFKRWQAAPVLKVSDHAFGRGRRFPVAHKAFG